MSETWNRFVSFQNARIYRITKNSQAGDFSGSFLSNNPTYFGNLTEARVGTFILILTTNINSHITHYIINTQVYRSMHICGFQKE